MIRRDDLTGLVLAGGRGSRMRGCDKGLEPFLGRPLAAHAGAVLRGHVSELLISANRHLGAYAALADRVVEDITSGYQGPLMGLYSGLRAARTPWLVVVPCDAPALPLSLVSRLVETIGEGDIAVAHDGRRAHPVVALVRVALADDLARCLAEGERKVEAWQARHARVWVDVSDCPEAFANLNTDAERQRLAQALGGEASPT
ncbi:molybdenum cofactor guanylyltransferase MobA [Halomonas caseinilytica]|uniref:Molybdenum cofactor guanylyltransferase n=1 Tax=Halomonas caseinilytica TaxID=438744 RepID=A0A1M6TXY8_9GAMM|nr:molybdenum cofactor guanylyltransferase MobA [Halomonas caseinilytica]SHK61799.1 molybdopterin-guanine dinucleotide biosynthesis protein A [Halomonas caseinilytica]